MSFGAFAVGFGLGVLVTLMAVGRKRSTIAEASLEEGFRTFIEHHVDGVDRDGDEADRRWDESYQRKRDEYLVEQYADK